MAMDITTGRTTLLSLVTTCVHVAAASSPRRGRPHKSWDDEINHFVHTRQLSINPTTPTTILRLAADQPVWAVVEEKFIEHCREAVKTSRRAPAQIEKQYPKTVLTVLARDKR